MNRKHTPLACADNVTEFPPGSSPFSSHPQISESPSTALQPALPSVSHPSISPPAPFQTPTVPSAPPAPDRFLQIKIESLKAKQRADSFFNSLDPNQAYKLTKWILEIDSLAEVLRQVTPPPPDGLGLDVSYSTLQRLRDAWRAEDLCTATRSVFDIIIDMEEQTDLNQTARIQGVMNHLLHETTFQYMRREPASPLLPELLAHIQKLTDLDLRRQKLQLEREKLLRKNPANSQPAQYHSQYHKVDLNIIPPARGPATVITSNPELITEPRPQLPPI